MKPRYQQTMIALAVGTILANLAYPGTALGQNAATGQGQRSGKAMSANPPPTTTTASGVPVTIDPTTGAVTGANGASLVLIPGTTTVVLPASTGAATAISGVAVPANSPQVSAMLAAFAGSSANLRSLETGLANRSAVTLTGAAGNATFVPPTPPLTAPDVTHALLLSLSQLAALGIGQPTPQQIQASLVGGNVINASGQGVPLQGVLQQRNLGLSFAQIAQGISPASPGNATAPQPPAPALARARSAPAGTAGSANGAQGFRAGAAASTGTETGTQAGTTITAPTGTTIGTQGTAPGFTASGTPGTQGTSPGFTASGTPGPQGTSAGFTASGTPGAQGTASGSSTTGGTNQAGAASGGGSMTRGGSR